MQVRQVQLNEKEEWNNFVLENKTGSFLQTWEWSEFLEKRNLKIWRLIVEEEGKWLACMVLYKSDLRVGMSELYAPRGPVIGSENVNLNVIKLLIDEVNLIAKQEKTLYFQMDPFSESKQWLTILDRLNFQKTKIDVQPRHTLILDIRKSEEEILADMHQKTRYNIRLAKKKEVEIIVDNSMFKEFYELLKKTMERKKINMFSQSYFKKILEVPFVKLYLAKYDGKIIAANIMVFYGDTVIYLFGATDYEYRKVMAPYLLQWQAIKKAKEKGFWFFDFWGAAPKVAEGREKNWSGFTKFKMGFSPNAEITEYLGTYEKVYDATKLGVYRFVRKMFKS